MPLKRKHEIKDPKDLIPDIADLEDDDLPEIDDIEIGPEDVIDLEAEEPLHLGPIWPRKCLKTRCGSTCAKSAR